MKMKRMKHIIALCLALIACVILIEVQSADRLTVEENCLADYGSCAVHTFPDGYIVAKEASCSSTGTKYRSCSVCGYKEIVEIPINPDVHSQPATVWIYDPAPTCLSSGVKFHMCYACGGKADITEVPPAPEAHSADGDFVILIPSTCKTEGEKAHKCKYCGEYFDNQPAELDPNNHVYTDESKREVTVIPTCALDGELVCYCDECGKIADVTVIPSTGLHKIEDEWTVDIPATCVSDGVRSHHCSVCGTAFDSEVIPSAPDNHTFSDDFTIDITPTCVTEGEKSRHCIYCGARCDIQSVPTDSHNHSYSEEWIVTREATCSEIGLMHQVCLLCGEDSVSAVIPKKEHAYGDYEIIKESSDGLSAQVKYTCSVCGYEYFTIVTLGGNGGSDGYIGDDKDDPSKQIFMLLPVDGTVINVDYDSMIISNIARNMTMEKFCSNFKNSNVFVVCNTSGAFVNEESYVGTGFTVNYEAIGMAPTNYVLSVTGDVNSDGKVTAADARTILRACANLETLENEYFVAADVNCDGKITAADARNTLRVASNLTYFEKTYAPVY